LRTYSSTCDSRFFLISTSASPLAHRLQGPQLYTILGHAWLHADPSTSTPRGFRPATVISL
jgi:hypothetical protein